MYGICCVPFLFKNRLSQKLFSNPFPKTAQIVNRKNPDLELMRRIHPECGFYGLMIRFWIYGGGGGGPPPQCFFFRPFGPQFGLKIRGGPGPPLDPPLDRFEGGILTQFPLQQGPQTDPQCIRHDANPFCSLAQLQNDQCCRR